MRVHTPMNPSAPSTHTQSAAVTLAANVTKGSRAAVILAPASLRFTATSWNTTQFINVSVADNSALGDSGTEVLSLRANSTDAAFRGLAGPNVTVYVADNDVVRV